MKDWQAWHADYDDPGSGLARRLAVVRRLLRGVLDASPLGSIRLLSLCAGEGRDVIGALAGHPRRDDVIGVLVEADPVLAARATRGLRSVGASDLLAVVVGDAGTTATFAAAVPADVVLLCGVFGNLTDEDIEHTVRNASRLCAPGAAVLWTRHPRPPDRTAPIRRWFADSGFEEVAFETEQDTYGVGLHRLVEEPLAFLADQQLFRFIER